jgi:uncharacterized protein involved in oxidation of intracellular sulfur
MTVLLIVKQAPYSTEYAFHALRLAAALQQHEQRPAIRIFLLSDGVHCAAPNQLRPDGQYDVEQMLSGLIAAGAEVKACVTCLDQRGLFGARLIDGVVGGTLMDLAAWTLEADRVVAL